MFIASYKLGRQLPFIASELKKLGIKEFKIGITSKTIEDRFKNGYSADGYVYMDTVAEGSNWAIINAEKQMVLYFEKHPEWHMLCENELAGNGNVNDADKLYIVARGENNTSKQTPPEKLFESDFEPIQLP